MSTRSLKAGKAFIEFSLSDKKIRAQLKSLQQKLTAFSVGLQRMGALGLKVGGAIAAGFALPVRAASAMQETMNKFNVVFGDNANAAKQWSNEFAKSVGRSKQQIASFMANSQDLFEPLGFAAESAQDLSKQVTGLAIDLASFNDMQDADVMRDLHAALTGSGEVMKKYGVIVSEAAVKQELLNLGMDPRTASNQAKVQARLNIIMRGTLKAQGDAIRSAWDFTNVLKRVRGRLNDLMAAVGKPLLKPLSQIFGIIGKLVGRLAEWADKNPEVFATIAKLSVGLMSLGSIFLAAGSSIQAIIFASGGFLAILSGVGAALAFVISPLGILSTLFTGLGTALLAAFRPIGLLLNGLRAMTTWFATSTESGREFVADLTSLFADLKAITLDTFSAISTALAAGDIEAAGKVLWAALDLLWLTGTAGLRDKWHQLTGGIAKIWHSTWAGLIGLTNSGYESMSRGISIAVEFMSNSWDGFVTGFKKAWNSTVAFFKLTWQRVKGFFGADVQGEINKINEELGIANAKLDKDRNRRSQGRRQAGQSERDASRQFEQQVLDQIGADLSEKLKGADDGTNANIAAAQKQLGEARKAWQSAKEAAVATKDATTEQKSAAKEAATEAAKVATGGSALASTSALGTFNGFGLGALQSAPNTAQERTAKAAEETASNTKRILSKKGLAFKA